MRTASASQSSEGRDYSTIHRTPSRLFVHECGVLKIHFYICIHVLRNWRIVKIQSHSHCIPAVGVKHLKRGLQWERPEIRRKSSCNKVHRRVRVDLALTCGFFHLRRNPGLLVVSVGFFSEYRIRERTLINDLLSSACQRGREEVYYTRPLAQW